MKQMSMFTRLAMTAGITVVPAPTLRQESAALKPDRTRLKFGELYRLLRNGLIGIPLVLAIGMQAHAGGNKCKADPDHTMQRYVDDDINMGSLLRRNPAFRGDRKIFDNHRIPNDIPIMPLPDKGVYRNVRPTMAYDLPEIDDKKFGVFIIACQLSCNYRITPACMVKTRHGQEMLVFFQGPKNEEAYYAPREDFELFRKLSDRRAK